MSVFQSEILIQGHSIEFWNVEASQVPQFVLGYLLLIDDTLYTDVICSCAHHTNTY